MTPTSSEGTFAQQEREGFLIQLASGATKTFSNAEQLFQEARILRKNGKLGRALFLHQISIEECAKVQMLAAWAAGLLMGDKADSKQLVASLASHRAKNHTNAYMLKPTKQESEARERGDWKGSRDEFEILQAEFHQRSNTEKNASLYVDFKCQGRDFRRSG